MTGGKYKFLTNQEKPSYLNKLLGQNIIFLAKEVGVDLTDDILTKVKVSSLFQNQLMIINGVLSWAHSKLIYIAQLYWYW